jgi:hypothetical protein
MQLRTQRIPFQIEDGRREVVNGGPGNTHKIERDSLFVVRASACSGVAQRTPALTSKIVAARWVHPHLDLAILKLAFRKANHV